MSHDLGAPIWLALILIAGMVALLGLIGFRHPEYGIYIIPYINIMLLMPLIGYERNEFLIQHFGMMNKLVIRFLENLLVSLPCLLIALFFLNSQVTLFIILLIVAMSLFSFSKVAKNIPTPFKRYPFEFIVFLRRGFYFGLFFAFVIMCMAIYVNNFNLGVVALGLLSLIALSVHDIRENELYVWNYNLSPSKFLRLKIVRSIKQFVVLVSPLIILLLFGFSSQYLIVLSVFLIGALLQALAVLMKYSVYPRILTIPDAIFFLIIPVFPPILPLVIMRYYNKAKVNLSSLL